MGVEMKETKHGEMKMNLQIYVSGKHIGQCVASAFEIATWKNWKGTGYDAVKKFGSMLSYHAESLATIHAASAVEIKDENKY